LISSTHSLSGDGRWIPGCFFRFGHFWGTTPLVPCLCFLFLYASASFSRLRDVYFYPQIPPTSFFTDFPNSSRPVPFYGRFSSLRRAPSSSSPGAVSFSQAPHPNTRAVDPTNTQTHPQTPNNNPSQHKTDIPTPPPTPPPPPHPPHPPTNPPPPPPPHTPPPPLPRSFHEIVRLQAKWG